MKIDVLKVLSAVGTLLSIGSTVIGAVTQQKTTEKLVEEIVEKKLKNR